MKLSQSSAGALKPGEMLRDHVVKGLELHAGATVKTWRLYYRTVTGERRRPKVGYFPALTIEAAREAARKMLREVAAGNDPSAERAEHRAAPTMNDLCDEYLKFSCATHGAETQKQVERCIRLYIRPTLGHLKVKDVTEAHTADLHARISEGRFERSTKPRKKGKNDKGPQRKTGGPAAANRTLAYLSGAFTLAESKRYKWLPRGSNPCAEIERNKERKRRVKLSLALFPAVHAELQNRSLTQPFHVAAIYAIMFSGSRISELVTAKKSDLVDGALVLDEHKTDRTGDVRTIRLPRQALALLDTLEETEGDALFPGVDRWDVWRLWDEIRETVGCPEVQPRDFRRTFASIAKSRGVSLTQIGELFDHKSTSTTDGYAYLYDDVARDATQNVADEIESLFQAEKN